MKTLFKWVQMSDIHFQSRDEGVQTDLLREQLLDYLQKNVSDCNALILSGDYRYAPTGDKNPRKCSDFIIEIAKTLGIKSNQIIAVPGNHDLDRSELRDIIIDGAKKSYDPMKGIIQSSVLDKLKGDFSFYYELCQNIEGICALANTDFTHNIVHLEACDVLMLNTALTSGKDGESGSLILCSSDLHKLLTGRRENLPVVAVGHHSLTELTKEERNTIESLLENSGVRLYLCGHAHYPEIRSFGRNGKEITVGCFKQGSNNIRANFVVGEIFESGDVAVTSHMWDIREKAWFLDFPRMRRWPNMYKGNKNALITTTMASSLGDVHNKISLLGYHLIGGLGIDGISYLWSKKEKNVESLALNRRLRRSESADDLNTSAYTISTSVGCQLSATGEQCIFCGTGTRPFGGYLNAEDIALQCIFMAEYDTDCPSYPNVRYNAREFAFMGQGEPGFNYPAIRKAIQMTDYAMDRLEQKVSRYIISTCGITDFMPSLIQDISSGVYKNKVTVHFSLHEIGDRRQELMPISSSQDYRDFIRYCHALFKITKEKIGVGILMFNRYKPAGSKSKTYTLTGDRLREILSVLDNNVFRIDLCAVNTTTAGKQQPQSYEEALLLLDIARKEGFEGKLFTSYGETEGVGCGMLTSVSNGYQSPGKVSIEHLETAYKLLAEASDACFPRVASRTDSEELEVEDAVITDSDEKYKAFVEETITQAIGSDSSQVPSYFDFLEKINQLIPREVIPYLSKRYHFLFSSSNRNSSLEIKPAVDAELQEFIYLLFLIDNGRFCISEPFATPDNQDKSEMLNNPNGILTLHPIENLGGSAKEKSAEQNGDTAPSYTDLEKATKYVLETFEQWLTEKHLHEGISLFVSKHVRQQPAGLQYGYDVGLNAEAGDIRYRLCFECKCYKELMRATEEEKVKSLTVDSYSYNLIQYYMHCTPDRNNRWILVCPFGDLQADFQERLFDYWNMTHDHMQIFAITEKQSWITCEEFLSVDDRAYSLVYPQKAKTQIKRSREEVFQLLYDTIIYDSMEDAISDKLSSYSIDENGFLDCQTILDVQTSEGGSALHQILKLLCDIGLKKNKSSPNMYGVYLIGEYGTGKTWLLFQVIREVTKHSGTYPFDPVLIKMKNLLSASDRLALASSNNISYEAKQIVKKFVQQFVISSNLTRRYRRCKGFLFLLDGLDEVLSGFSYTNGKIEILSEVISDLRSKYPSSLFVVTSRESDYNACKKHSYFNSILTLFHLVELSEIKAADVRHCIDNQAQKSEKDIEHLRQLATNESFIRIMQTPVFFTFLLDLVERPKLQQIKDDNEGIDKYIILNEIVTSAFEKLNQNQSTRQKILNYAWLCTRDNLQEINIKLPGDISDKENDSTISSFVPTDIMRVRRINDKECALSFKHNIIREFLATQQLYGLLRNCCNKNSPESACVQLCQKLKELPMTVEMQQLLRNCIERNDKSEECIKLLESLACDSRNKSDVILSTKLMELLLQPGHGISASPENMCNLSGIHVHGLYIWRSFLKHIDLRGAQMTNLQVIDAELIDVDFRGANLTGLQVCSDAYIKGIAFSRANNSCTIAVMYNNGLILEYYLQSVLQPEQYMVKVIGTFEEKGQTGMHYLGKKLLVFNDHKVYEIRNNKALCVYELNLEKHVTRVFPSDKGQLLLDEGNGELRTYRWIGKSIHARSIHICNPEQLCYVAEDEYVIVRDGQLFYVHEDNENVICSWASHNTCFTAFKNQSGEIYLYLFSVGVIKTIRFSSFSSDVPFAESIVKHDIKTNNYNTHRSARCIDERILITTSETAAFVASIDYDRCVFTELKAGVKCIELNLGDYPGGQRVEDENAYHLLKALSCENA